jgi:hypothetical protein
VVLVALFDFFRRKYRQRPSKLSHGHRFGHEKQNASMPSLDGPTQQEIVELLTPLMERENERHGLLRLALGQDTPVLRQINFGDAVQPFILHMIGKLTAFGEIEPGKPALWALLEVARDQVGVDRQARIDTLLSRVANVRDQDPKPSPEPIAERNQLYFQYVRKYLERVKPIAAALLGGALGRLPEVPILGLRDTLADGTPGPAIVWLPGGVFTMGEDDSHYDDEKPAHEVTVSAFSIGQYPVTFEEYDRFCEATRRETGGRRLGQRDSTRDQCLLGGGYSVLRVAF